MNKYDIKIRRTIKNLTKHYPGIDSRRVIHIIADAFSVRRQRVSADLRWAQDFKKVLIQTNIAGVQSDLYI